MVSYCDLPMRCVVHHVWIQSFCVTRCAYCKARATGRWEVVSRCLQTCCTVRLFACRTIETPLVGFCCPACGTRSGKPQIPSSKPQRSSNSQAPKRPHKPCGHWDLGLFGIWSLGFGISTSATEVGLRSPARPCDSRGATIRHALRRSVDSTPGQFPSRPASS